jgi:MinD-like ATPase involved in chromosome partitioning or flagellar assembly
VTVLALASAKGAPGVGTASLALAAVWPADRAVLVVEADPAGSALAPRFALPYERGVASLAPASRHRFVAGEVAAHSQSLAVGVGRSEVTVLVGVRGSEQGRVLSRFWDGFAAGMAARDDQDVIADCGRLGPDSPCLGVVANAHMTLLLVRPDVEGVVGAQLRVSALRDFGVEPERLAVVVVGERPRSAVEVAEALDVPVVATLAYDTRAAAVLSGLRPGRRVRLHRCRLLRSARSLCDTLERLVVPSPPQRPAGWDDDVRGGGSAAGVTIVGSRPHE